MKLVTAQQMQAVDKQAIDGRGIPGLELMEHAGRGIAFRILEIYPEVTSSRVAVFCGKGNNGGDAFVVARYLHEAGVNMLVFFLGPVEKLSDDARVNFDRAREVGLGPTAIGSLGDLPDDLEVDFAIEAIFGTGFSGAPRGFSGELIEHINELDATIVSIDLPSGLNADTGRHEGAVVQASHTFTLALPKFGQFVSPGRELSGRVDVIPIGIPPDVIDQAGLGVDLITLDEVSAMLPNRKPDGHKGTFGRVLCIAGSEGLTGAAAMAAESALRCGCGMLMVGCPRTVQPVMATKLTEATTHPFPDVRKKGALALRALGEVREVTEQNDAVILGPGIGRHHETFELVRRYVSRLTRPTIIDADGLNALAGHTDTLRECEAPLVLTPHPGEFKRLTGSAPSNDIHERITAARDFAAKFGVVLLLKGSPTVIADPDGRCFVNPTGNAGMASGGTGDVLSGAIGSFMGQGMSAIDAAIVGAFVHGLAGDLAADDLTQRAVIAGDLITNLPEAFALLGSD